MGLTVERGTRRPIITIGIVASVTAAMAATGVGIMRTGDTTVTVPYYYTAAIDTSNTTVGFADSILYGETPADIDRSLDEMQAMGVNNVRILLPWAYMEPVQGYDYWTTADYIVNAANERGMGILGTLNSTPDWAIAPGQPVSYSTPPASNEQFAAWASEVATRYAGKISAYEVWNEPNSFIGYAPQPDAAGYTQMLKTLYPAIKAADPNATVVGGVLISVTDYQNYTVNPIEYLDQMYAAGAQGSFDALSFHPYQYTLPFSQGAPFGDAAPIVQMDRMHQIMVANGDGDKLIWSTEYGTPTSVVSESTQAAMIQDYLSSWSQIDYAGPSFIYTTRDINSSSSNADDTFGVIRDDWSWKPAAYVIAQWTAEHPQQPVPADLMAAMRTLEPDSQVAVDPATGALNTVDPATGQPIPVTELAAETSAEYARLSATSSDPVAAVGRALQSLVDTAGATLDATAKAMSAAATQLLTVPPSTTTPPTSATAATAPATKPTSDASRVPNPNPTLISAVEDRARTAESGTPAKIPAASPTAAPEASPTTTTPTGAATSTKSAPSAPAGRAQAPSASGATSADTPKADRHTDRKSRAHPERADRMRDSGSSAASKAPARPPKAANAPA